MRLVAAILIGLLAPSSLAGCLEALGGRSTMYSREFEGAWDAEGFYAFAGTDGPDCSDCARMKLWPGRDVCYVFDRTTDGFLFEAWYSPELSREEDANLAEYWNGAVASLAEHVDAEPGAVTGTSRVHARC